MSTWDRRSRWVVYVVPARASGWVHLHVQAVPSVRDKFAKTKQVTVVKINTNRFSFIFNCFSIFFLYGFFFPPHTPAGPSRSTQRSRRNFWTDDLEGIQSKFPQEKAFYSLFLLRQLFQGGYFAFVSLQDFQQTARSQQYYALMHFCV